MHTHIHDLGMYSNVSVFTECKHNGVCLQENSTDILKVYILVAWTTGVLFWVCSTLQVTMVV